jgi:hypothetical protein
MPAALIAVGASVAGSAIGGALASGVLASIIGSVASFAIQAVGSQILGGGSKPPSFSSTLQDRTVMVRQPITTRKIVYGKLRVSGPLVFHDKTKTGDGTFHHLIVALASHEIESIDEVYFDNKLAWSASGGYESWLKGTARINLHLGASDQAADQDLINESSLWSAEHRGGGVAHVYVRIKRDTDVYPNGFPSISATIKGKKCYDPRTGLTVWTANPILCLRDYLSLPRFGLRAANEELDDAVSFIADANTCEESVALLAGGTEARYELHGQIDTAVSPRAIIEGILTACMASLIYSGGVFSTANVSYQTPSISFNENHLRAFPRLQLEPSNREVYNAVKGKFASLQDNYVLTDYPSLASDTYRAEDGGDKIYKDLTLPFTVSSTMAQRLEKIYLLRSRMKKTVFVPFNISALRVKAGDNIMFSRARYGWTNKVFNIYDWTFAVDSDNRPGIDVTLRETAPEIFDWSSSEEVNFLAGTATNLPDPRVVDTPGVSLSDTIRIVAETLITVLIVDVTTADDTVDTFEANARKQGTTEWINVSRATSNRFELLNVEDGQIYEVRARAINSLGVKSEWTDPVAKRTIIGKTAPPADVENFSINIIDGASHLSWNPVADADLSHYRVRWSPLTTGAVWSESVDITEKVPRPTTHFTFPAITGTFFIKAVDTSGNISDNPASVTTILDAVQGLNAITTITEHPAFSGTKTNCEVVDDTLRLMTESLTFGDFPGVTFGDLAGTTFGDHASSYAVEGSYEFGPEDLGAVYTSRVTARILVSRFDVANTIDAMTQNIDEWVSIDGDAPNSSDTNVELYVATTNDDPGGSPTWSAYRRFVVGDYTARAFKFKAVLKTENTAATPAIEELSITIDMPDRVIADQDLVSGTDPGGYAVVFNPAFYALQGIGIHVDDLDGASYVISGKSATGFTILFSSGGSPVSRTFGYTAKGHGVAS